MKRKFEGNAEETPWQEEMKRLQEEKNELQESLRARVECPVCYEVPTSGPLPVCPNGHIVCWKCNRASCPVCRTPMTGGVSLLASTVLERIDHKCPHEGCTAPGLPLQEMIRHKAECQFRSILCPASRYLCGKTVPACLLLDHILTECSGSGLPGKNGTILKKADMISKDWSVANKLVFYQPYRNPSTTITMNMLNLNRCDVYQPTNPLYFAFQWNNRYYYLKKEIDLIRGVKLSVIVIDDVTPKTESKGDVKFVLRMIGDQDYRNGKVEYICPILAIDEDERNSDGFKISKSMVRKFSMSHFLNVDGTSNSEPIPGPSGQHIWFVAIEVAII